MYSSDTRSATPVDLADMSDAGSQAENKPSRPSQVHNLTSCENLCSVGSDIEVALFVLCDTSCL